MRLAKWNIILLISITVLSLSFIKEQKKRTVPQYYDAQLDSLLSGLSKFQMAALYTTDKKELLPHLFTCRNSYKKVEFLIDVTNPYMVRRLNGPDLLKIEEENPRDSVKPHGFQTIEAILYTDKPDKDRLNAEITELIQNVKQLRNESDRVYYFTGSKVCEAMRLGVFRIISLGLTGFDVPQSYHALPETRIVLSAVYTIAGYYKKGIGNTLYKRGSILFANADKYLVQHSDFNTFDRITFIRSYLNPISEWLYLCSKQADYINYDQRNPLNPDARHLFAPDIMNLSFFSPNERYRINADRVQLGKRLFYDKLLSGDGSRSCASCHQPGNAFTDGIPKPNDLSGNKVLLRNTPTLWNVALQTRQFYDSRTETLENQLSAVVHNTDEMNGSLRNSIGKLNADTIYAALFRMAYPNKESITEYNIANAIASYVRTLISLNSRFDRYMRRQTDSLTVAEKNGFNLFVGKAKCGTCHYAPVFNGLTPPLYQETESEILAVPATNGKHSIIDSDPGKEGYTRIALHKYAFKTPTVRNAALTAPYMHNGVFNTLEEVLNFYNDGGGAGRGITLETQTLPAEKLNLTKKEMKDIIAFLHALTDTSGTSFPSLHYQ